MKFSIIIPVYNVAPYVCACLDSVLSQTYGDWEAVCVNDGSRDGAGAILDAYTEKDPRFKVIHQDNAGVGAARNAALDAAKGEWIVFVDGDDALVPWALATLDQAIASSGDADLIRYREQSVVRLDEPLPDRLESSSVQVFRLNDDSDAREGYAKVGAGLLAWNCCHRRSSLGLLRFKPYPNGEDGLFGLEAFLQAKCVARISDELYRYRINRAGSAVLKMSLAHVQSECEVLPLACAAIASWRHAGVIRESVQRRLRLMVCGICLLPTKVAAEDRAKAWQMVLRMMRIVTTDYRDFCGGDWLRWHLAAAMGCAWAVRLFVNVPFAVRVWLLKLPGVEALKQHVRRIR